MRSKAPLMLMEQMIMLLVFALVAALCLQAFVKAESISRESEARDRAVLMCQSVAEQIKDSGEKDRNPVSAVASRLEPTVRTPDAFAVFYDADWNRTDAAENAAYIVGATNHDSGVPGLGRASVYAQYASDGTDLFRVDVMWQGVIAHG